MGKKKIPIFSIVLYVFAGLLVLYTTWAVIHCQDQISTMIAQGKLELKGNEYDIVNFYMVNCAQYVLFAVIIFTLGWILQKNSSGMEIKLKVENQVTPSPSNISKDDEIKDDEIRDDDFKDWLKDNDK